VPEADLTDITDTTWVGTDRQKFQVKQQIDHVDVAQLLRSVKPWKAPSPLDEIPMGFLKACGEPLTRALARIANASLRLEYFPARFRQGFVAVLRKPGKSAKAQRTPGAYRPITLLSCLGKVIEAIMASRIAAAAEEQHLLPDCQMGNRKDRSTELAIRIVTDAVFTAWRSKAVASLLQLDLTGAFDRVNHIRLLHVLTEAGFPL
jgi:hypothetical protein